MTIHASRRPSSRSRLACASVALVFAVVLLQAGAAFVGNAKSLPQRFSSRSLGTWSSPRPVGGRLPRIDGLAMWWARSAAGAALCCAAAARMLSHAPRHASVARMAAFRVRGVPVASASPELSPNASPPQSVGMGTADKGALPSVRMQQHPVPSVHMQQHPMPSVHVQQHLTGGVVLGPSTLNEASASGQRATRPQAACFLAGSRRSKRWRSSSKRAARVAAKASQRHVGGKLHRPAMDYPPVRLSFDPSLLRNQIQRGLWIPEQVGRERGREAQVQSAIMGIDIMNTRCSGKIDRLFDGNYKSQ